MANKIVRLIPKDARIVCPWCHRESKADDWNSESQAACVTREMRRAFVPIFNSSVFHKDSKYFYTCPLCGQWSRGNKLRILRAEEKVEDVYSETSIITEGFGFQDNGDSDGKEANRDEY